MSIIDKTYFQKANGLNIPLSESAPIANASMQTPNMEQTLDLLIDNVEKSVLLNALGLELYKLLIAALPGLSIPGNERYKDLVQGEEYDGKVWEGLEVDESLLAWRVMELFQKTNITTLTGVGNVQVAPEKAKWQTPADKIAEANQNFIKKYQGNYNSSYYRPQLYGVFTDYYVQCEEIEVSLYKYLNDKQDVFPEFKPSSFKFYEIFNYFGL